MKKLLITTINLLISTNALAYASKLECGNMEKAHRKATSARLQSVIAQTSVNSLDLILENIEKGMIYRHCDLSELGEMATHITVKLDDALYTCTEKAISLQLVREAAGALNAAARKFGGFRATAHEEANKLVSALEADIKSDSNCK